MQLLPPTPLRHSPVSTSLAASPVHSSIPTTPPTVMVDQAASSSAASLAPEAPSLAFSAEQFHQLLHALGTNLAASQQATSEQLSALAQALQRTQTHGTNGYSAKPPTFRGDGGEDVEQFLSAFNRHADFFSWSSEKRLQALPLSLVGHANIWFTSLSSDAYHSFDDLTELLRGQFNSPASLWLARQQLNQRKMATSETVASYSADIRRQCQLLRIPKPEWLHVFIQGLRPDIREHLVLQQPQTFEQAEQLATLKEAVSRPAATTPSAQDLVQALLSQLPASPQPPAKASQVAAFTSVQPSNDYSTEPVTMSSLRRMIQTELRKALQDGFPRSDFRSQGARYNNRFNNPNRNRRTPDGHPICNTCNRRGHTSYNCPTLNRRDPRLPDRNRDFTNRRSQPQTSQFRQENI